MYDTNKPAFLERDLVGLSVDSNWQVWVRYHGGEPVPMHAVGKGATGFTLELRSFSKILVASPMSQLILQPFFRFSYVSGFHLRHLASHPC